MVHQTAPSLDWQIVIVIGDLPVLDQVNPFSIFRDPDLDATGELLNHLVGRMLRPAIWHEVFFLNASAMSQCIGADFSSPFTVGDEMERLPNGLTWNTESFDNCPPKLT